MLLRFDDLPLPVRERFVQITTTAAGRDPRILVFAKPAGGIWLAYVGGVGAIVMLGYCLQYTIVRGQEVDPSVDIQGYLGVAAAIAVLLVSLSAIAFRLIWKPPPFREGMYVFPSYLVKTRGGELDVRPITELGTPTIVTVRRNGSYQHTRLELGSPFTFYYNSDGGAKSGWEAIATARARFRAMMAARDGAAIAAVDPFAECTISGTWSYPQPPPQFQQPGQAPPGPLAQTRPRYLGLVQWGIAMVIGLLTAGIYYAIIDAVFDDDRAEYHKPRPTTPPRRR